MSMRSQFKPWYGCATKRSIKADEDARYYEKSDGFFETEAHNFDGLRYRHTSTHNGYIPPYDVAVVPYHGKFGNGLIVISYHSKYRVLFKYYVERRVDNGKNKRVHQTKRPVRSA